MANRNNNNLMPGNLPGNLLGNHPRLAPLNIPPIPPINQNVFNQGRQEFNDYINMMPENRPENHQRPPPLNIPRLRLRDINNLNQLPIEYRNRLPPPAPLGANNVPNPFDNMGGQV